MKYLLPVFLFLLISVGYAQRTPFAGDISVRGIQNRPVTTAERALIGTILGASDEAFLVYDSDDAAYYSWDGAAWQALSVIPGGADTELQYNNAGAFGGMSNFTRSPLGLLTYAPTLNQATGNEVALQISPTINKLTSGNYTGIEVNVIETSAPGADNRLFNFKVGGNPKLYVDSLGDLWSGDVTDPLRLYSFGSRTIHHGGASSNMFIGKDSGNFTMSGTDNIGIGLNACAAITSAVGNVGIGRNAGLLLANGGSNVAVGRLALDAETSGAANVAIGASALGAQNGASNNVAIGRNAGVLISTGQNNTAVGDLSLDVETSGSSNVAIGKNALGAQDGVTGNTAVGGSAGLLISSGTNNVMLGYLAGDNVTSGGRNLIIGAGIDAQSATDSNQMSIANLLFSSGIDGTGITASTGNLGVGVAGPTAKLDVNGDTIRLRAPRTPATAGAAGNTGDIVWDSNFIYVCVATNTWKRVAIATW
jgi:hypothetical protein